MSRRKVAVVRWVIVFERELSQEVATAAAALYFFCWQDNRGGGCDGTHHVKLNSTDERRVGLLWIHQKKEAEIVIIV